MGNHGKFDRIALGTLRSLKKKYPHIRYAIARRNKWMVEMSGYVIAYVKCNVGGAARYKTLAEKKGKTVLNLAQLMK